MLKLYIVHLTCAYMGVGFQCALLFEDREEAIATHTRVQFLMQTEPDAIITFEHKDNMRETVRIGTIGKVALAMADAPPKGLMTPQSAILAPQFRG